MATTSTATVVCVTRRPAQPVAVATISTALVVFRDRAARRCIECDQIRARPLRDSPRDGNSERPGTRQPDTAARLIPAGISVIMYPVSRPGAGGEKWGMHPHFFSCSGPGLAGVVPMSDELEKVIEERIEEMGYEFVELERAGSKTRPILRVRVDIAGGSSGEPGTGVTIDECARVSRRLEEYLDEKPDLAERYVLEVSSPGVERPLTRRRDYERYTGKEVALRLSRARADGAKRVEGELLGLGGSEGQETVRLRLVGKAAEEVEIPREDITRAHLVFRWKDRR